MRKLLPATNDGFTIIETLIVLAIAGLILTMIALILPTITRNSNNNLRRKDVQAILSAIGNYQSNHLGSLPPNCGNGGSDPSCDSAGDPTHGVDPGFMYHVTLNFYDISGVHVENFSYNVPPVPSEATLTDIPVSGTDKYNWVDIRDLYRCAKPTQATTSDAGPRDTVALYYTDGGGHYVFQCQSLD